MRHDPKERLTVAEFARRLCRPKDGMTPDYHAQQVRRWIQLGVLVPIGYRGHGPTAAAEFGEFQLFSARLFVAMTMAGLTPDKMKIAAACFGNISPLPTDGAAIGPGGASAAYIAARIKGAGEQWYLVLHLTWDGRVMGSFTQKPTFDNPLVAGLSSLHLVIDCRAWFGDLLGLDRASPEATEQ